jgi:hypothetical protein
LCRLTRAVSGHGPLRNQQFRLPRYAIAARATSIHVTGYRAAFKLTEGGDYTEPRDLAERHGSRRPGATGVDRCDAIV